MSTITFRGLLWVKVWEEVEKENEERRKQEMTTLPTWAKVWEEVTKGNRQKEN